ncbi:uncharacterized protein LOC119987532 [Tripterygium wilfordii]|uniref:uncharacterized protein LOC119987532 n=1 Tax=Tripterygium wilfordii TaxID=458696 RepID=UPI0018F82554|nr:uncharacterized protein LOC119987532 [Tripterygium wilfordii]
MSAQVNDEALLELSQQIQALGNQFQTSIQKGSQRLDLLSVDGSDKPPLRMLDLTAPLLVELTPQTMLSISFVWTSKNFGVTSTPLPFTTVEDYFRWYKMPNKCKVDYAIMKLKGNARIWWLNIEEQALRLERPTISELAEMKFRLKERYMPTDYMPQGDEISPQGEIYASRRICAGVAMAETMFVYSLATLLHSFDWKLPQGEKLDLTEKFGIVLKLKNPLVAVPIPRLSDPKLYD